jgi:hypothetical protein
MAAVVSQLREHGVSVETSDVFLLDLSDHRFPAPRALDGIPVQMNFTGSVPPWDDRIRFHLHVYLLGGRRWSVYEPPRGFNVPRIVSRILAELERNKLERSNREQEARDRELAEERFTGLSEALGAPVECPLKIQRDNFQVEALPHSPGEVMVTIRTSHENAERIIREFRSSSRCRRKS